MRPTVLIIAVVAVLLIGVVVAVRPKRRPRRSALGPVVAPGIDVSFPSPDRAVAILPVTVGLSSPGTARLVDELATSVLDSFKAAHAVDVRTPDGALLGTRSRGRPRAVPARSTPAPARSRPSTPPLVVPDPSATGSSLPAEPPVHRSLADRLDLPSVLRRRLADPDDPVDIVEQVLRGGGHDPDRSGNVLRLDGHILIVLGVPVGSMVGRDDLNRAYAQFRDTGSRRGLVVAAGYFPSREIARRQVVDPGLRYAGLSDLQRMADAAAAGADPLDFVMAPRLNRTMG